MNECNVYFFLKVDTYEYEYEYTELLLRRLMGLSPTKLGLFFLAVKEIYTMQQFNCLYCQLKSENSALAVNLNLHVK